MAALPADEPLVALQSTEGLPGISEHGLDEKKTGVFFEKTADTELPDMEVQEPDLIKRGKNATRRHDHKKKYRP